MALIKLSHWPRPQKWYCSLIGRAPSSSALHHKMASVSQCEPLGHCSSVGFFQFTGSTLSKKMFELSFNIENIVAVMLVRWRERRKGGAQYLDKKKTVVMNSLLPHLLVLITLQTSRVFYNVWAADRTLQSLFLQCLQSHYCSGLFCRY